MKKLILAMTLIISSTVCAVNAEETQTVDKFYRELKDNDPIAIVHFADFSKGILYWELFKNQNDSKCTNLTPRDTIDFFMAMYQRKEFKIGEDRDMAIIKTLIAQCPDLMKK